MGVVTRAQRKDQGSTIPFDPKTKRPREEKEAEEEADEDRKPAAKPQTTWSPAAASSSSSVKAAAAARKTKNRRVTRDKPRTFVDPRQNDDQDVALKAFLLEKFSNPPDTPLLKPKIWRTLSTEWQNDPEVALAALKHNYVRVCDLSLDLQYDKDFLLDAVAENANQWYHLPYCFKFDADFPRAMTQFPSRTLITAIFQQFPDLRRDQEIVGAILDSTDVEDVQGLVAEICNGEDADNDGDSDATPSVC